MVNTSGPKMVLSWATVFWHYFGNQFWANVGVLNNIKFRAIYGYQVWANVGISNKIDVRLTCGKLFWAKVGLFLAPESSALIWLPILGPFLPIIFWPNVGKKFWANIGK